MITISNNKFGKVIYLGHMIGYVSAPHGLILWKIYIESSRELTSMADISTHNSFGEVM